MEKIKAIRARHSVRQYKNIKIEKEIIKKLQEYIETINIENNLHLQFIEEAGETFNRLLNKAMGLGSAPSVIACVGPDDETVEERIGYFGQQIVIYAQQLGLNTCWAGTFNKKTCPAEIRAGEKLPIVIAIGYGATQGKERKSKNIDQVTRGKAERPDWFIKGVEAALLAPTAVNQQKFEICLNDDNSVTITDKGGIMGKIDRGIVKYNFEIGAAVDVTING